MLVNHLVFMLIYLTIDCCKNKTEMNFNSSITNIEVEKSIKEYINRNKDELRNGYILQISSNNKQDTLVLSISYWLALYSIIELHPYIYGYLDSIPYIYFSGAENIIKIKNDSIIYQKFISQVFKDEYLKYVIQKKTFPPPPTGVIEILHLYVLKDKIIRNEYDDNIFKDSHEIRNKKRTTGDKQLDSILNLK